MTVPLRFHAPVPAEQSLEQRRLQEAILAGPRAGTGAGTPLTDDDGRLVGPFGLMMVSPDIGMALQQLGAELRSATVLDVRVRELAILLVAGHEQSAFEQYSHEPLAQRAGFTRSDVEQVRAGRRPAGLSPAEALAMDVVEDALADGPTAPDLLARARAALGVRACYELLTLVGYYRLLALQMDAFGVLPPSTE